MQEIVQDGAPVLRRVAVELPERLFGSAELSALIRAMSELIAREPDGVALAAPQVGISWRLFIVRADRALPPPAEGEPARAAQVEVYINPKILRTSRRRRRADEGCLSVRGVYGTTTRHERVTLSARDQDGRAFERGAGGLLAQIFEHEMDHLNGGLFIDHAENLIKIEHSDGRKNSGDSDA